MYIFFKILLRLVFEFMILRLVAMYSDHSITHIFGYFTANFIVTIVRYIQSLQHGFDCRYKDISQTHSIPANKSAKRYRYVGTVRAVVNQAWLKNVRALAVCRRSAAQLFKANFILCVMCDISHFISTNKKCWQMLRLRHIL